MAAGLVAVEPGGSNVVMVPPGDRTKPWLTLLGCVRIAPKNAATLYALVKENGLENTQVVVTGVTPGGEYNVAEDETSPRGEYKVARGQTGPRGVGRASGVPYYNGSQGYYGYYNGSQGYYGSPWPWTNLHW